MGNAHFLPFAVSQFGECTFSLFCKFPFWDSAFPLGKMTLQLYISTFPLGKMTLQLFISTFPPGKMTLQLCISIFPLGKMVSRFGTNFFSSFGLSQIGELSFSQNSPSHKCAKDISRKMGRIFEDPSSL